MDNKIRAKNLGRKRTKEKIYSSMDKKGLPSVGITNSLGNKAVFRTVKEAAIFTKSCQVKLAKRCKNGGGKYKNYMVKYIPCGSQDL